jgi:hypothetical protein
LVPKEKNLPIVLNINLKGQNNELKSLGLVVACIVEPSVNTLKAQLIFLSKPNFCNLFGFLATKSIFPTT